MTYLIIGSTGNVGRALVARLHQQGHGVRAFVRAGTSTARFPDGVELAVGNLDDADSLTAAARGADGVFFMQVVTGTIAQAENMVRAAHAAGVRRIVQLSSVAARQVPVQPMGAVLAAREQVLRRSGLDVTYLRPRGLMSNALWWAPAIRAEGRVTDATDPGLNPCVDPDDIARVAAVTLTQDGHAGHGYILSGPEALTAREQVATLVGVLGRPIEFAAVTPEQLARDSIERGTPAGQAEAMRRTNERLRAVIYETLTDDVENLTGTAPGTFRDWCERHADAFR
jgi:uncharacterized protein YbjT (DUF2867 family)